ncbi:hypothetical protein ACM6PT_51810, partial [Klebsiella pneumoniae]
AEAHCPVRLVALRQQLSQALWGPFMDTHVPLLTWENGRIVAGSVRNTDASQPPPAMDLAND